MVGIVSNVDLWMELLELLDLAQSVCRWIKVLRHAEKLGNKRADALAEMRRKASSLMRR